MTSRAEIEAGLLAHAKWKRHLRQAIRTQESEFTPATVRSEMACEFGKWLSSLPPADRGTADYQAVSQLHRDFHHTAAEILELALSGRIEDAALQLEGEGPYSTASGRLVLAMQRWQAKL